MRALQAGRKGSTALMQLSDHDIEQYEQSHQHTGPLWQNLARARFGAEQSLLQYSPLHSVGGVACPLLIIAGTWGLCLGRRTQSSCSSP